MKAENQNRTPPAQWEDEAPAEPRFRRMQQGVPPSGRVLPGMPLEMDDAEDDELPRPGKPRFSSTYDTPSGPWWRPSSSWGRALLTLSALTVAVGLGVATYALHNFLAHDARFRIDGLSNIEAAGLSQVSRDDVLPVFGEDIGKNIFFVSLKERRQQLEHLPWVERATVMRLLPDHIRVQIVEREPVAFVRLGSQIELVDGNGVLLSMPPAMMAQRHYSFPVVTGINANDSAAARRQRMDVYNRLIKELDADGHGISKQISEIDLSNPDDAKVMLPDASGEVLAHFGDDHFQERYRRYTEQIVGLRAQYPRLATIDLRYEDSMVLDMKPGTEGEQPAAGDAKSAGNATVVASDAPVKPTAASKAEDKPVPATAKNAPKIRHDSEARPVKAVAHPSKGKTGAKLNKKPGQKTTARTVKASAKSETGKHPEPKRTDNSNRRHTPARPALDPVLGQ